MKNKRKMNETQIEKKAQRETERLKQYQEGKRAEELANGMALSNTALEQHEPQNQRKGDPHGLCKS